MSECYDFGLLAALGDTTVLSLLSCFHSQSIGTVGVPIKLLFEAEGMKITVEVSGVLLHF